ncbi:uncharacterized protein CLUP02_09821 [Colletotrichum lupini]|uniref:Uncharacterized protein n=1 Tax=Colletotrichum lupini TaxID=145971 RepID=A0A9Q8SWD8_9PEZI|nr:uncharacterized protein CLUP02_09821 [Colletotrichum lupini]UQC84325.1 hypothetical protein CLUP02_09821 [Colletotrichum lupini]
MVAYGLDGRKGLDLSSWKKKIEILHIPCSPPSHLTKEVRLNKSSPDICFRTEALLPKHQSSSSIKSPRDLGFIFGRRFPDQIEGSGRNIWRFGRVSSTGRTTGHTLSIFLCNTNFHHQCQDKFSKRQKPTAITSHRATANLPYELALNIMDYDVLHAESTDPSEITFGLDRDDDTALGVSFYLIDAHDCVNRKIRSMVLGKFYFMYRLAPDGLNIPNFVFINPKKDIAELKPLLERMCKTLERRNIWEEDQRLSWPNWKWKLVFEASLQICSRILQNGQRTTVLLRLGPLLQSLGLIILRDLRKFCPLENNHVEVGIQVVILMFTQLRMPNGRVFSSFGVLSRLAFLTDSMNLPYCFFRARVPASPGGERRLGGIALRCQCQSIVAS